MTLMGTVRGATRAEIQANATAAADRFFGAGVAYALTFEGWASNEQAIDSANAATVQFVVTFMARLVA